MSKLISLDKQIEEMATKWYIKEYFGPELESLSKEERAKEIKKIKEFLNKETVVKKYLEAKPKVKKQYQMKKQRIRKIRTLAGLGILTLAVGTGVTYKMSQKEKTNPAFQITIEQDENIDEDIGKQEEKQYEELFDELNNTTNTEKRNEQIVDFTKQKIVEAYNKQAEEKLTKEQLEYYHLNEYVVANKDTLGNDVSYQRTSQNIAENTNSNQELKRLNGGIYEFKVDGKTVAVYDSNGQEIIDNNVEEKDAFFQSTLGLVKEASKLQDVYKYKNTENDIKNEQNKYKLIAQTLVEQKELTQTNQEQSIEKE